MGAGSRILGLKNGEKMLFFRNQKSGVITIQIHQLTIRTSTLQCARLFLGFN